MMQLMISRRDPQIAGLHRGDALRCTSSPDCFEMLLTGVLLLRTFYKLYLFDEFLRESS